MIDTFIDNELLLKLYNTKLKMKEYHQNNREKLNKRAHELYHNKYKNDETFKKKVHLREKDYLKIFKINLI